jgi:FKBP-type peptidyl-prolyl cis-trans isomerase SlyD
MTDGSRLMSIEYTLTLDDGRTVDTNVGGEPLIYREGGEQILPALEAQLVGVDEGQTKQVILVPAEGYGDVDPEKFHEVEIDIIPDDAREVGMMLVSEDEQGRRFPLRVHEVREDMVVLDANHPLAGQTLYFEIKVLSAQ